MGSTFRLVFGKSHVIHLLCIYNSIYTFSPELVIDISSPVKQKTGDFVDVEDKILKLFDVPKKRTVRTKSAASL